MGITMGDPKEGSSAREFASIYIAERRKTPSGGQVRIGYCHTHANYPTVNGVCAQCEHAAKRAAQAKPDIFAGLETDRIEQPAFDPLSTRVGKTVTAVLVIAAVLFTGFCIYKAITTKETNPASEERKNRPVAAAGKSQAK